MKPPAQVPATDAWTPHTLQDVHQRADKSARVQSMFDAIAPTYERVNAVISLGQDAAWRRRAVLAASVSAGDVVLDLCCGTGDMIRAFDAADRAPALIIGLDFSTQMLARGHYANMRSPFALLRADAQRLPLRDGCVDVASCAFGMRNLQDLSAGLREVRRVLRPGGRLVILEFALPDNPLLRVATSTYCNVLLPRLAAWISRDRTGAYRYLPRSIDAFERRGAMLERLRAAGLAACSAAPMNLGSVVLYRAERG